MAWENELEKLATEVLAIDVTKLDKKIQNRIKQLADIHKQINKAQEIIKQKVGALQQEIKALEKQATTFEKELIPILKEIEDHIIDTKEITIELKIGRRSPKTGYDYLAERVNSELLRAAEEAITKAAEFAQSPTIKLKVASIGKEAGMLDWIKNQWNRLKSFIKGLKKRSDDVGKLINQMKQETN